MILLVRVGRQEGWGAQWALVSILIRPGHSENLFQDRLKASFSLPFSFKVLGQFGTLDNLEPRTIWHLGQFGTAV